MRSQKPIVIFLEPFGILWLAKDLSSYNPFWFLLILLNSVRFCWIPSDSFGIFWIFWNLLESLGFFWNLWEYFGIFEQLGRPRTQELLSSSWNILGALGLESISSLVLIVFSKLFFLVPWKARIPTYSNNIINGVVRIFNRWVHNFFCPLPSPWNLLWCKRF